MLAGPARGYVIEELKKNNIPFHHSYVETNFELIPFYQALDIYLITSREEGGPMGLIESMSCGIPVVTTNVGMAQDVISNGISGSISYTIDSNSLAEKIEETLNVLYKNEELQKIIRIESLKFDWKFVAEQHWQRVYKDLI